EHEVEPPERRNQCVAYAILSVTGQRIAFADAVAVGDLVRDRRRVRGLHGAHIAGLRGGLIEVEQDADVVLRVRQFSGRAGVVVLSEKYQVLARFVGGERSGERQGVSAAGRGPDEFGAGRGSEDGVRDRIVLGLQRPRPRTISVDLVADLEAVEIRAQGVLRVGGFGGGVGGVVRRVVEAIDDARAGGLRKGGEPVDIGGADAPRIGRGTAAGGGGGHPGALVDVVSADASDRGSEELEELNECGIHSDERAVAQVSLFEAESGEAGANCPDAGRGLDGYGTSDGRTGERRATADGGAPGRVASGVRRTARRSLPRRRGAARARRAPARAATAGAGSGTRRRVRAGSGAPARIRAGVRRRTAGR